MPCGPFVRHTAWRRKPTWRSARQCFPAESRIQLRVEQDPESDDFSWLVVDVGMEENVANALACYDKFVDTGRDWTTL